ncbi:MAG: Lactoylglutathione lyase [Candidatus Adlerbacteria bacterium]|nr:Lactoylglutathione lyase [Candidatus Adlerbacteria bacterium]
MIAHVSLHVSDMARSKEFFAAALHPLGYKVTSEFADYKVCGFGVDGNSDLWIDGNGVSRPMHVAFEAKNDEEVNEFHKAALAAGGKDNGAPGIRKDYSPGYYAAFALDPDGNNIEVVHHQK